MTALWKTSPAVLLVSALATPVFAQTDQTDRQPSGHLTTLLELLSTTYDRAPALVFGLAVLIALPPVALLGMALRRGAASPETAAEATRVYRRNGRGKLKEILPEADAGPLWPSDAWVELADGTRFTIGNSILRLGRDADNDVYLDDKTVHRYHAAIHRTDEAAYVITDLSSTGGNGVLVNGHRVPEVQLADGDRIELGQVRLTFVSRPA